MKLSCAVSAALLIFSVLAPMAHAKCQISDFNVDLLTTTLHEVGSAVENLKVLEASPLDSNNRNGINVLPLAIQMSDRAASEGAMFGNYLLIYEQLLDKRDQDLTAAFILDVAKTSLTAMTSYGDFLTLLASSSPQRYAGEMREARDRVRKLQRQFACAAQ